VCCSAGRLIRLFCFEEHSWQGLMLTTLLAETW
jgi:hypothetical protein